MASTPRVIELNSTSPTCGYRPSGSVIELTGTTTVLPTTSENASVTRYAPLPGSPCFGIGIVEVTVNSARL